MNLRTALRKSSVIAPIEDAMRRADNQDELEDVWFDMADGFGDQSPERKHLLGIYNERLAFFRSAEAVARALRV